MSLIDQVKELGRDRTPDTTVPARLALVGFVSLVLMSFATWHIFYTRFPDGWKWFAVLGLVVVEGASLVWFHVWTNRAVDHRQVELAKYVFILCVVGSVVTSLADAGEQMEIFILQEDFVRIASFIVVASFAVINAVAWMVYGIWSPEHEARREEYLALSEARREELELRIERAKVAQERAAIDERERLQAESKELYARRQALAEDKQRVEAFKQQPVTTPLRDRNDGHHQEEKLPNS